MNVDIIYTNLSAPQSRAARRLCPIRQETFGENCGWILAAPQWTTELKSDNVVQGYGCCTVIVPREHLHQPMMSSDDPTVTVQVRSQRMSLLQRSACIAERYQVTDLGLISLLYFLEAAGRCGLVIYNGYRCVCYWTCAVMDKAVAALSYQTG